MVDSLNDAARAATTAVIAAKRDELLAERQELTTQRSEILTRLRRNDRELSDCRAAARLFGLELEFPPDEEEERSAAYAAVAARREAELRNRQRIEALHHQSEALQAKAREFTQRLAAAHSVRVATPQIEATAQAVQPPKHVDIKPANIVTRPVPALRDFVLEHLEHSAAAGSKAAPIRELYERTFGRIIHEKTVGMTLYRLSKLGLVRRDGQTWFFVLQTAETKNPGGETPGLEDGQK